MGKKSGGRSATDFLLSKVVRLSVLLAPDVASALKKWCSFHDISITEGVRRAIACWIFVERLRIEKKRLIIIETNKKGKVKIREVEMI